jgi:acyl-CoA dehydrogenase
VSGPDPELNDAERELAARVDRVARDELVPIAHAWGEQHAMCRDLIEAMARHDLFGLNIPAEYGGQGGDHRYSVLLCLLREALGHRDPVVDFHFGLQGLGTVAIARQGDDRQRAAYLPDLVRGRRIFAFALTEPESGSDVLGMRTRATRAGDGWDLHGTKTFISGVPDADVHVVVARTGEAERGKDVTAFIVEQADDGLVREQDLSLSAPHAIGTLRFHGCHVSDDRRLGEVDAGLAVALGTLEIYRPSVGALAVGMGRRAITLAAEVAVGRQAFEQRLVDFEAIRTMLARRWVDVQGARRLVYRAAHRRDAGEDTTREAAMAKLRATEAAHATIYDSQQVHGGRGVLVGSEVEAMSRHVRQATIYEGTSEIQRMIIARRELRRTADGDPPPPVEAGPRADDVAVLRTTTDDLTRWVADAGLAGRQAVQFRLADLAVRVDVAALLDERAGWQPDTVWQAAADVAVSDAADLLDTTRRELARRASMPAGLGHMDLDLPSIDERLLDVADHVVGEVVDA